MLASYLNLGRGDLMESSTVMDAVQWPCEKPLEMVQNWCSNLEESLKSANANNEEVTTFSVSIRFNKLGMKCLFLETYSLLYKGPTRGVLVPHIL